MLYGVNKVEKLLVHEMRDEGDKDGDEVREDLYFPCKKKNGMWHLYRVFSYQ